MKCHHKNIYISTMHRLWPKQQCQFPAEIMTKSRTSVSDTVETVIKKKNKLKSLLNHSIAEKKHSVLQNQKYTFFIHADIYASIEFGLYYFLKCLIRFSIILPPFCMLTIAFFKGEIGSSPCEKVRGWQERVVGRIKNYFGDIHLHFISFEHECFVLRSKSMIYSL